MHVQIAEIDTVASGSREWLNSGTSDLHVYMTLTAVRNALYLCAECSVDCTKCVTHSVCTKVTEDKIVHYVYSRLLFRNKLCPDLCTLQAITCDSVHIVPVVSAQLAVAISQAV